MGKALTVRANHFRDIRLLGSVSSHQSVFPPTIALGQWLYSAALPTATVAAQGILPP